MSDYETERRLLRRMYGAQPPDHRDLDVMVGFSIISTLIAWLLGMCFAEVMGDPDIWPLATIFVAVYVGTLLIWWINLAWNWRRAQAKHDAHIDAVARKLTAGGGENG